MYIRRKVFSILDTEEGDRLFSLDQKEFTGETKRRNKALKRQWLEKMGGESHPFVQDQSIDSVRQKVRKYEPITNGEFRSANKILDEEGIKAASRVNAGRYENKRPFFRSYDVLASKERLKRKNPDRFKAVRESDKNWNRVFKNLKKITKVFSVLGTEDGERLFSTTDYMLDQYHPDRYEFDQYHPDRYEFDQYHPDRYEASRKTKTKRRNKALKRQYLEKMGEKRWERVAKGDTPYASIDKTLKSTRDSYAKFGQKGAGDVALGRMESLGSQKHDELAWKERIKRDTPDIFKDNRKTKARIKKVRRDSAKLWEDIEKHRRDEEKFLEDLKKMGEANPNPEVVVSNSKPVIKTESKLSRLAKNKYAQAGAGLLVLGGTAGGYYLLNKKKNKKDKEDKD